MYIIANTNGVLAYDFEGNFKRKIVDIQTILQLFSSVYDQYILNNQKFFATLIRRYGEDVLNLEDIEGSGLRIDESSRVRR